MRVTVFPLDTCDFQYVHFVNEQEEKREKVLASIVTGFAPELVASIFTSTTSLNTSDSSDFILRTVYTSLSEKLAVTPSETKFNNFVEAVTEITAAEEEACSKSVPLSARDIPEIVEQFNEAFSRGRNGDITEVRDLYGQMLCIKRQEQVLKRRKRSYGCPDPSISNCGCPDGGLKGGEITCVCHFFGCLDPDQYLKPILGFVDWKIQCLAFVVDTTGSMRDVIKGTKEIILDFIRAEDDLNIAGCYLLVPFNDVGPDDHHVPNESKWSAIMCIKVSV